MSCRLCPVGTFQSEQQQLSHLQPDASQPMPFHGFTSFSPTQHLENNNNYKFFRLVMAGSPREQCLEIPLKTQHSSQKVPLKT